MFNKYNVYNDYTLECLDLVKYIHNLNYHFGQFVDEVIRSKPDEDDAWDVIEDILFDNNEIVLELIYGVDMNVIKHFETQVILDIIINYIEHMIFDQDIDLEYMGVIDIDIEKRIDIN